jgi:hypothetical protein
MNAADRVIGWAAALAVVGVAAADAIGEFVRTDYDIACELQ